MRTRAILLVVAILLVAAFATLNWSEIARSTPLSFGVFVMDAPLGAILLGLLAIMAIAFTLAAAGIRTQSLMDSRTHHKTLEAQRLLADKAEASRFTDLRTHLDTQLRQLRERDAIAATEFEKAMVQGQRELRTQLDQVNRTIASRLTELETRLDARLERGSGTGHHAWPTTGVGPVAADHVHPTNVRPEHVQSQVDREVELRDAQLREQRLREEKAAAADRPADAGWRRWF
jgi:hypothetical protein